MEMEFKNFIPLMFKGIKYFIVELIHFTTLFKGTELYFFE
jgi:hypothetical protein